VNLLGRAQTTQFTWKQTKSLNYELQANGEVFASLKSRSSLSLQMMGTSADDTWILRRKGVIITPIEIIPSGMSMSIALLKPAWRKEQRLEFKDGRVFIWNKIEGFKDRIGFIDTGGNQLVSFELQKKALHSEWKVFIKPNALKLPELSLLVILGRYKLQIDREDSTLSELLFWLVTFTTGSISGLDDIIAALIPIAILALRRIFAL